MATDVVPGLIEAIDTAFKTYSMSDRTLASVSKRIRDGTATQVDGHTYALRLGKNASKALQDVLTEKNLPDGKLYYNIATRTVIPTLENNQALINDAAVEIQKVIDSKAAIRLNAIKPKFPKERVNGLIDKMTADDISLEDALVWIREPIVNNSEAFFDDFIRENAEFRSKAGLKTTITRIAESKCCEWCEGLAGTYEYGYSDTMPEDIFRRHEFCRCVVTVTNKKSSEDVWSKRSWQSTPDELARRESTKPTKMSKEERQNVLNRLDKDKTVKKIIDATGYDRETANRIAGQGPKKVQEVLERERFLKSIKRR